MRSFSFGNYTMFASDVMPKKQDELTSNIAISLGLHDEEAAKKIFDRLSAEVKFIFHLRSNSGETGMAISKTVLVSRWMVNCSKMNSEKMRIKHFVNHIFFFSHYPLFIALYPVRRRT